MDTRTCPCCDEEIEVEMNFDTLGDTLTCPGCGNSIVISYEESYDSESGDESGWFYLEKK